MGDVVARAVAHPKEEIRVFWLDQLRHSVARSDANVAKLVRYAPYARIVYISKETSLSCYGSLKDRVHRGVKRF